MGDDRGVTLFTERMVPEEAHPRIFWEHIERYRFAREFVAGKRVLDVACGEGYGAAALSRAGAVSVIGVDISAETCAHAASKVWHRRAAWRCPGDSSAGSIDRRGRLVRDHRACTRPDRLPPGVRARAGTQRGRSSSRRPTGRSTVKITAPIRIIGSSSTRRSLQDLLRHAVREVQLYSQFAQSAAWWSPRSLAAERSPWMRVRGFWRLSAWICPAIRTELSPADRESAVQLILGRSGFPRSLFNPYVVRPRSKRSRERPYILVAVARRPRFS